MLHMDKWKKRKNRELFIKLVKNISCVCATKDILKIIIKENLQLLSIEKMTIFRNIEVCECCCEYAILQFPFFYILKIN
jgi:hypothetical protein